MEGSTSILLLLFLFGPRSIFGSHKSPGYQCSFHVEADTGESCERIALSRGISQADIEKWNTDCDQLRMGSQVCVSAVKVDQVPQSGASPSKPGSRDKAANGGRARSGSPQQGRDFDTHIRNIEETNL